MYYKHKNYKTKHMHIHKTYSYYFIFNIFIYLNNIEKTLKTDSLNKKKTLITDT